MAGTYSEPNDSCPNPFNTTCYKDNFSLLYWCTPIMLCTNTKLAVAQLVSCDNETAAKFYSEACLPVLMDILNMFPSGLDTFPTPYKQIMAHTL
jgi:hypothetical protein